MRRRPRLLAVLALPLLAYGCSRGFDVVARAENGALAFRAAGAGWFDFGEADEAVCSFSIQDVLSAEASRRAAPAPRPGLFWQEPGTMWAIEAPMPRAGRDCPHLPIVYGRTPPGMIERVPARRLVRGRAYRAFADAPGAMGGGDFRIVAQ